VRTKSWWNWFWQCCTFGLSCHIVVVVVVGGGGGLIDGIISLYQLYALFMTPFQLDRLYRVKFNGMMSMKS